MSGAPAGFSISVCGRLSPAQPVCRSDRKARAARSSLGAVVQSPPDDEGQIGRRDQKAGKIGRRS